MTPEIKEDTGVFPGENWFLYWKTSSSLWKKKLSETNITSRIFVPIYWAFHTENNDQFDFGNYKPETNLSKLVEISKELGLELVFLLPFTPMPLLPNGGIPSILAQYFSKNESGLISSIINMDGKINKFFSFFDTRIFQAYSKFVKNLGQYFINENLTNDLWGINSCYLQNNFQHSYIEDFSVIFDKTFEQFLKSEDHLNLSQSSFKSKRIEFTKVITNIYKSEAEKFLSANWEGDFRVHFLGGSEKNFYQNLNDELSSRALLSELIQTISFKSVPSTVLLNTKSDLIKDASTKLMNNQILSYLMEREISPYQENENFHFLPFHFFCFYEDCFDHSQDHSWENLGILDYINSKWGSSYSYEANRDFSFNENVADENEKIYFFQGHNVILKNFYEWLKIFMSGGKIIINRHGISLEILKRMESFILENELKVQKIEMETDLHHIVLGEGSITLFDSEKISKLDNKSKLKFWKKLLKTYSFKSMPILRSENELEYLWLKRGIRSGELGYEEVRRIYFFNPSSYVKNIKIEIPKNFSLIKIVDQKFVDVETHPNLVKMIFQPGASLSIDWGVFS